MERGELAVVAGATGYLGRYVVRALHERGFRVRALVRSEARLGFARPFVDEVFVGEATRPESLRGLCDGAALLFSSLGLRSARRRPTIWEVDRDANLALLALAREAGVRRFAFVSVLGGPALRSRVPQAEAREQVVDELLRGGPSPLVLRPTGFFNDMAELFGMARRGRVWLVGQGARRLNPIHGADLAEFVAERVAEGAEGAFDVGGPQTFTHRQVGELAFEVLGRPARFGRVPPGLLRASARLLGPLSPNLANVASFLAAMDEVDAVGPPVGHRTLRAFFEALREGVPPERAGDDEGPPASPP